MHIIKFAETTGQAISKSRLETNPNVQGRKSKTLSFDHSDILMIRVCFNFVLRFPVSPPGNSPAPRLRAWVSITRQTLKRVLATLSELKLGATRFRASA